MKYIILAFLMMLAVPSLHAQITLEHTYTYKEGIYDLVMIDSNEQRYVGVRDNSLPITFSLYNLNHTLDKSIVIPKNVVTLAQNDGFRLEYITRHLFSLDGKIGFLLLHSLYTTSLTNIMVLDEDGKIIFERDSFFYVPGELSIFNTTSGAKMMLRDEGMPLTYIYSLPGKLPGSSAHSSVTPSGIIEPNSPSVANAYPNPSNGSIRIEYKLPEDVSSGEIIITNISGVVIRKYKVGSMFTDILIDRNELLPGAYFYRLITTHGESELHKLIIN